MPLPPRIHEPLPGRAGRPALWPWLGLLAASSAVTAAVGWQVLPATMNLPSVRSHPPAGRAVPRPLPSERRRVRLFFPQESGDTLKELERDIPQGRVLAEEVRAVLRELRTRLPGARPPLPPTVEVRQVFLDGFGILYLDFNKEIQAVVAGPGARPEQAISAIVNSLAGSFSEVKRVQFLVEGKEMAGAAGGWDLRRPISPRFPGEETSPGVAQPQE